MNTVSYFSIPRKGQNMLHARVNYLNDECVGGGGYPVRNILVTILNGTSSFLPKYNQ